MIRRLRTRVADSEFRRDTEVVEASAEDLPFASASFDTVVSTMVLCTVADVESVLSEVARVLKPGGRLLFIEHVHAGGTRLGRWQLRMAGLWAAWAQGCRCDRDLVSAIRSRFDFRVVRSAEWVGMPVLVRPLVVGSATPVRVARHGSWAHHVTDRTEHAAANAGPLSGGCAGHVGGPRLSLGSAGVGRGAASTSR
jgi:SAM-dependent methyltransferase